MQINKFTSKELWLQSLFSEFNKLDFMNSKINIALSGGNSPVDFYRLLSKHILEYNNIYWWLGDERCVSVSDDKSNQKMIYSSLFTNNIPNDKIHFWPNPENPEHSAKIYQNLLLEKLGKTPIFDLIILGIGDDGHVASLFPESKALLNNSDLACVNNTINGPRLTFTFKTINAAKEIWILAAGKNKEKPIKQLIDRDISIPATFINIQNLKVFWYHIEEV